MVLIGFWGFTPWLCDNQSKFQSYSTYLNTKHYHSDQKNFWKIFQFSRKTYIVCKIGTKVVFLEFWSVTPWLYHNQSKSLCYSTNLHTKHYHSDQKEILEIFPVFQKNLDCVQNWDKKMVLLGFWSVTPWLCDN